MRICLLGMWLLLAARAHVFSQLSALKGTWINPQMQVVVITDTTRKTFRNYLANRDSELSYDLRINGDTLSFLSRYAELSTRFRERYGYKHDLKVIRLDQRTLVLKAVSKPAADLFGRTSVTFTRQEFTTDSTIRFDKLLFESGACFGTCPAYQYEIDDKRNYRLLVKTAYVPGKGFQQDSSAQGYFSGQVPDSLYRQVVNALQTCYLRQLTVKPQLCCDAPLKTLTVFFSGQKKSFETMFPPIIVQKLVGVLDKVYRDTPRQRTNTPFILEQSKKE